MLVGVRSHAPAGVRTGKTQNPLYREAGWAPGQVWTCAENFAPPPGFDPRTVQPVASRYTDRAIPATRFFKCESCNVPSLKGKAWLITSYKKHKSYFARQHAVCTAKTRSNCPTSRPFQQYNDSHLSTLLSTHVLTLGPSDSQTFIHFCLSTLPTHRKLKCKHNQFSSVLP